MIRCRRLRPTSAHAPSLWPLWPALGCLLLTPAAARAQPTGGTSQPYPKIAEVMLGTAAAPQAQYIVLRLQTTTAAGDRNIAGFTLVAYNTTNPPGEYTRVALPYDVAHSTAGDTILIANQQAEDAFEVTPDYAYQGEPFRTSGELCLYGPPPSGSPQGALGAKVDCFIYGYATDSNANVEAGRVNHNFNPGGGLPPGLAAQALRNSNDSRYDFWLTRALWPQANLGAVGSLPASTCGNGVVEGLEACDGGAAGDPNCSATCLLLPGSRDPHCGDGHQDPGEICDDGNTASGDGCSAACQLEPTFVAPPPSPVCGNHLLELGESCDDNNRTAGDGCDPNCQTTLSGTHCGNGAVEPGEQCDNGPFNGQSTNPCASDCFFAAVRAQATCGNGVVEPGETCDDGNTAAGDGCSATCALETAPYFTCGDGILQPLEQCDAGQANASGGSGCQPDCTLGQGPGSGNGGGGSVAVVANPSGINPESQGSGVIDSGSAPDDSPVSSGKSISCAAGGGGGGAALLLLLRLVRRPQRRREPRC